MLHQKPVHEQVTLVQPAPVIVTEQEAVQPFASDTL